jgi:aminoglycoside phosphotransferase (APT) family kinase protein
VAGSVPGRLVDFVDERLVGYAHSVQPVLDALPNESRLVHSDFNPKNLLAEHRVDGWVVTAVLDWEFAFSGHPLVDVGNLLRFRADYPPAFADGFEAGYRAEGGALEAGWQAAAGALDMFALADLLTRGPDSPLFDKVVDVLKGRLG